MRRNFNIAQILESVDIMISDNIHKTRDKNKISNRHKRFINKNISMPINPKTEKIITDAEKSIDQSDFKTDSIEKIDDQNYGSVGPDKFEIDSIKKTDIKNKEEINFSEADSVQTLAPDNRLDPLILNNELIEEEEEFKEDDKLINRENNLRKLEEENNLESLENNLVYINNKLITENIKIEEKIKDQNILLDKFLSKERYTDLDKKIKLYQEDNAALRKKILKLSDHETALRLQLSDLSLDHQTRVDQNETLQLSTEVEVEKEDIKILNIKIEDLLQKNNQLETELSELKKARETQSMDVDQKIKFYREENAKIIVDKSDIERKLENTKNQLSINENNKKELKVALDNLNQILGESNIDSSTFINKIEEQIDNTNPIIDKNTSKKYEKLKSKSILNDESLDLLIKEIFTK